MIPKSKRHKRPLSWRQRLSTMTKAQRGVLVAAVLAVVGLLFLWQSLGPWMQLILDDPDKPWQYMDGFGFHPYGSTVSETMATMDTVKSYMEKVPEFAKKPIWITEVGCWTSGLGSGQNTPCNPQTESGKAAYLKGMFDAMKTWNTGTDFQIRTPIAWYILHESGGANGFGLESGGNKFEAYTAFKNYSF